MNTLKFSTLRIANVDRCRAWHPGGVGSWSLSDWSVAMIGEAGEACNVVKKMNRIRDGLIGNKKDDADIDVLRAKLADELADTVIYLDLLAAHQGIDLGRAVVYKFNAVSKRNGLKYFITPDAPGY